MIENFHPYIRNYDEYLAKYSLDRAKIWYGRFKKERKKERKSRVRVLERPMQLIQISRKKKTFYVSKRAGLIYSAWTGPRNSSVTHFRENADVARLYTIYREKKYGLRLCLLSINLALMKPAPSWNRCNGCPLLESNSLWTTFHDR